MNEAEYKAHIELTHAAVTVLRRIGKFWESKHHHYRGFTTCPACQQDTMLVPRSRSLWVCKACHLKITTKEVISLMGLDVSLNVEIPLATCSSAAQRCFDEGRGKRDQGGWGDRQPPPRRRSRRTPKLLG